VNTVAESHQQNASERGVPEDARKRFELLEDCREMVISRLSKVIGEALAKMGEELAGLAIKAKDTEEQRALMDAVSVVRQHRAEIELRFRRSFSDVFERRMFNKAPAAAAAPQEPEELALVDDSVMQAKLAVDRCAISLRAARPRCSACAASLRCSPSDWQHFKVAGRRRMAAALLDAFEPHVSANLNVVYSSVNERLKANRVLPKIRVAWRPDAPCRRDRGPRRRDDRACVPGATSGDPLAGGPLPTASEMQAILAQLANGNASARDTVTRMLSNPDTFAVADLPIPSVEPPVLDALSSLQASSLGATVVSPELIADLADRARESDLRSTPGPSRRVRWSSTHLRRQATADQQQLLRLQVALSGRADRPQLLRTSPAPDAR
jgi:hypothetical protein